MLIEQALQGAYSFYENTEMALQSYNVFGFHIEKKFFDANYCAYLINEANTLSRARANNFKPVLMPHKENVAFLEALRDEKTVKIISQLIGGLPCGLQTQFFYCKPGTRGFSLHQDNFYVQAKAEAFASIWVALVDTTAHNGGLIIYPGSHKEEHLPVRKLNLHLDPNQDPNANNEETIIPENYQAYDLTLDKGDALFLHANLVHGSNDNKSEFCRYALLNLYIKNGEAFRKGNSAQREAIALTTV